MRQNISVCMATFNGDQFLRDQLQSIIGQLEGRDEVIVVDDGSTDETLNVLKAFAGGRVRIFRNQQNMGHVAAFERAILLARNDIIFLADQDDIWTPGRVDMMVRALEDSGKVVVSSNSEHVDASGAPVKFPARPLRAVDSTKHVRNIGRVFAGTAHYYGCTMAFRRVLLGLVCPIPSYVESHDLWIVLAGNLIRSNWHIEEATLNRRIHGGNAGRTGRRLSRKIRARMILARSLVHLTFRCLLGYGRLGSPHHADRS